MAELKNPALERLRAGELAIGIGLRQARTSDIAKVMLTAGYDWLFIDLEHNSMNLDTAVQISIAAQASGIAPIVRVPSHQPHHATRVLDGGALGVVIPHVDDVATAQRIASSCRYPPRGHRSVIGGLPQLDFASLPVQAANLFAMLGRWLIIEFVPKSDSQVIRMLTTREDIFPNYSEKGFEAAFEEKFTVERREVVEGSERTLYLMRARSAEQMQPRVFEG